MGWFSDSSEDEAPAAPSSSLPPSTSYDEDPLDAYMNSLDSSTPLKSSARGRLDHDAEDEATSHWEKRSAAAAGGSSRLLPSKRDESEEEDSSSREAKLAMSSTFVRAGDKRQPSSSVDNDHIHNDDESTTLHDRQHQEITPLEKTDTAAIRYPPFRRTFLSPQNTPAAAQWRTQHDITCVPPIDPLWHFDKVFPSELMRQIAKAGYDGMTLVQCQTLGVALAGRDGLITAATGSGKSEFMFCLSDG
jgi:hypothetical protein